MLRQRLPHEHRSLHFRVRDDAGGTADYTPAIVARRGSILFLVEPIRSAGARGAIDRLSRFLDQHSPEIVLVAVTSNGAIDRIPHTAYDEIYTESDVGRLAARIREQNPEGIVRPFEKPPIRDIAK